MTDLSVTVRGHDILITEPDSGQSVTYSKLGYSPILMALDPMRGDLEPEQLSFLVQAWKAAFAKAKSLGWLDGNGVI
jgi:hypothetical protein